MAVRRSSRGLREHGAPGRGRLGESLWRDSQDWHVHGRRAAGARRCRLHGPLVARLDREVVPCPAGASGSVRGVAMPAGRKQRLVLDCRRVNMMFREPPGISSRLWRAWGSASSRTRTRCSIKDCFYGCGMDDNLAQYFSFDFSVRVGDRGSARTRGSRSTPTARGASVTR